MFQQILTECLLSSSHSARHTGLETNLTLERHVSRKLQNMLSVQCRIKLSVFLAHDPLTLRVIKNVFILFAQQIILIIAPPGSFKEGGL